MKLLFTLILSFGIHASAASQINLISVEKYSEMTSTQKNTYIQGVRRALYEFETEQLKNLKISNHKLLSIELLTTANADDKFCVMGGKRQPLVGDVCSSKGNSCGDDRDDNFKCGQIFANACISRDPIKSISERCLKESKNTTVVEKYYSQIREETRDMYGELCMYKLNNKACDILKQQIAKLEKSINEVRTTSEEEVQQPVTDRKVTKKEVVADKKSSADYSCLEVDYKNQKEDRCVEGSVTVRKNSKGRMSMQTCVNTSEDFTKYDDGIDTETLYNSLKTHKEKDVVAEALLETGSDYTKTRKALNDSLDKKAPSTTVFSAIDDKKGEGLKKLAALINIDKNKCDAISALRLKIDLERNLKSTKKPVFDLKDLQEIADGNQIRSTPGFNDDVLKDKSIYTVKCAQEGSIKPRAVTIKTKGGKSKSYFPVYMKESDNENESGKWKITLMGAGKSVAVSTIYKERDGKIRLAGADGKESEVEITEVHYSKVTSKPCDLFKKEKTKGKLIEVHNADDDEKPAAVK